MLKLKRKPLLKVMFVLKLHTILLEMSPSQTSRKLDLRPRRKSLLSEKLIVKTLFTIFFVSIKINHQLEPIRTDERIDNRG